MGAREQLIILLQQSKQAVKLYSTYKKEDSRINSLQASVWHEVNLSFYQNIANILKCQNVDDRNRAIFNLRDKCHQEWRGNEGSVCNLKYEAESCLRKNEYLSLATLAENLIKKNAELQAFKACFTELDKIIKQSRIVFKKEDITEEEQMNEVSIPTFNRPKLSVVGRS
jgi:hypothetical protein